MAEDSNKNNNSSGSDKVYVAILGAIVAAVILIPTLIAGSIWFFLRKKLGKLEYSLILLTSGVGLTVTAAAPVREYFSWLYNIIVEQRFWPVPFEGVFLLSGVFLGIFGLVVSVLGSSRVFAVVPFLKAPVESNSVIPTEREERSTVLASPPKPIFVDPTAVKIETVHQTDNNRLIPLGYDKSGTPMGPTEKMIGTHGLIFGSSGSGKALSLDTPIPTPKGWTTMGELTIGDYVFDENGKPCRVTFATEVQYDRECFEVVFSDGTKIIADAEHNWFTWSAAARISERNRIKKAPFRKNKPGYDQSHKRTLPSIVTTAEIKATLITANKKAEHNHAVQLTGPVEYAEQELPIAPYTLGAWLGDGNSYHGGFTSADEQVLDEIRKDGYVVNRQLSDKYGWGIQGIFNSLNSLGVKKLTKAKLLIKNPRSGTHIQGSKHIPKDYLQSSVEQRLALLQGLMDTDGYVSKTGNCEFTTVQEQLAFDFQELLNSLGIKTTIKSSIGSYVGKDGVRIKCALKYRLHFTTTMQVVRLERKLKRLPTKTRTTQKFNYITEVNPIASVPVRCIQVDSPNHLYLAGKSYTVTHNTETIKALLGGVLDLGWNAIVLDMKQDLQPGGLRDFCNEYASDMKHTRLFQEIHLDTTKETGYWFNALAGLTRDEARDAILATMEFDDAYYQSICRLVLGQACEIFYLAHDIDPVTYVAPNLYDIGVALFEGKKGFQDRVAVILDSMPHRNISEFRAIMSASDIEKQQAASVGTKLLNVYGTEVGQKVLRSAPTAHAIDVTRSGVTYIGLNSLGMADLTNIVSTAVLSRLGALAGQRASGIEKPKPTALIIDEANYIDRQSVDNLLSRARSAGISITLCTQSALSYKDPDRDWFPVFAQNTNFIFVMKQSDPAAALVMADYLGKEEKQIMTQSMREGEVLEGFGSMRNQLEYKVAVEDLRVLKTGTGIFRVGTPYIAPTWVRVVQRDPHMGPLGPGQQR